MRQSELHDATLLLVGHGSTRNPGSALPVYRHAETLRQRGLFAEVLEAFWLQEPRLTQVWPRIQSRHVYVVPLFIGEGYFTTQVIPEALSLRPPDATGFDRHQEVNGRQVYYGAPIGIHPLMTGALLGRVLEALRSSPGDPPAQPATTTLVIAGHGTSLNHRSRETVEAQVAALRQRQLFAEVLPAFMEEEPRIAHCSHVSPTPDLVVVPFFISDGLHTLEDIPVLLGADPAEVKSRLAAGLPPWVNPTSHHNHRIWYTPAVGTEPFVAEIILQRVYESIAASGQP